MGHSNITQKITTFAASIQYSAIPESALHLAKLAFIDTIGVAVAARTEPVANLLHSYLNSQHAPAIAEVLGLGIETSPELAAFAGGTMAHALDYDDVSEALYGHPSAVLVPALLAASTIAEVPGQRLLKAYVVGFEVAAALGRGMNPSHYLRGWHATSTIGVLGAAISVSILFDLPRDGMAHALGIAASLSSGLRRNFGSMAKPIHAGHAARSGLFAATLAQSGFSANGEVFDGQLGFADVFGGSPPVSLVSAVTDLGTRWTLADEGIWFKRYPCCASAHRSIDACLALCDDHDFEPDEVVMVTSYVPAHVPDILVYLQPQTGLQAKFSLQYCLAAALLDRFVSLDSFVMSKVARPEALALGQRIRMEVVHGAGEETVVEIKLRDGRCLAQRVIHPRGHPQNPLTDAELERKFRDCYAHGGAAHADDCLSVLQRLESLPKVCDLRLS